MGINGNQWGANGKAVEKSKRYVLPFGINGNSMVNQIVFFTIRYSWE